MNNPNNLNLTNPFASDSINTSVPFTNPSPFKLFKSQTPSISSISNPPPSQAISSIPPSSQYTQPFSSGPVSSNINPQFNSTNPLNSSSNPFFNASSSSSNPISTSLKPSIPSSNVNPISTNSLLSAIQNNPASNTNSIFNGNKELESKKNQILNKKRIQDLLDEWKQEYTKNLQKFHSLSEKGSISEKSLKNVQKEVVILQEFYLKIKADQKKIEENIEMMLTEQNDLNGALDVIDKEIDKVLNSTGIYIGFDDKENIYKQCNMISKSIDNAENMCSNVLRQISDKHEDIEDDQDVGHTIDIFLETLDWIERSTGEINERMIKIENEYKYLL